MRKGWAETTIGTQLTLEYGKPLTEPNRDGMGYPVFGSAGVVGLHSEPLVTEGQVIIVGRKGTAGAVYWSQSPCFVIDTAYFVQIKTDIDSKFLFLLLTQIDLKSVTAQTGVPGLNRERAYNLKCKIPPLHEQKRIVDLIASVDSYIEALQRQLENSKRSRNAILHELLTAGGEGWVETSLGVIAEVIGGGTPSTKIGESWDGDIVWLTPTEITSQDGKVVSDSIRKITELGFKNSGAQMLPMDSVILTSRASVGFVALAGKELCTNQGFQSLIPKPSVLPKFLMFWIQLNRPEFESRSAGSTFKEISKSNVKSIKLELPPLSEQKRIVEIINTIDEVISKAELIISEAQNLRSGLLSDLLIGEHEIPASYDKVVGAA